MIYILEKHQYKSYKIYLYNNKMENHCNCCTSSHEKLMDTWTHNGSLHPNNYDPFKGIDNTKENYCSNTYNCLDTTYTRAGNVTPANSPGYNTFVISSKPIKENFDCESCNSSYVSLDKTWTVQKPYSSN